MKKALSYKIIFLFITLAISLALTFAFYGVKTASAADITQDNVNLYFSGAEKFELKEDNLVATVNKEDGKHGVSVTNALVVDDLAIELNVPATVSAFKVILTYDSYFTNGAYNDTSKEFDSEIKNEFTFTNTGDLTVKVKTAANVLSVQINDDAAQSKAELYYKIKGADKCSAKIAFDFTLTNDTDLITVKSIDQKLNDGTHAYKQTFALDADNKIAAFANPRVLIDSLPMLKTGDDLKVVNGNKYTFAFKTYSVFANISSGSVYIDKDSVGADVWVDPSTATPKSIIFENAAPVSFSVRTTDLADLETYSVLAAVDRNADTIAPEYIDYGTNSDIYEAYQKLVDKAALKNYGTDDEPDWHSIRLGDSYTVPSLQDLIQDDLNVYSDLNYTVYYRTPSNASGTTSSLKFTVSEAGDYEFFVVFKDANNNEMNKDDFYTVDTDDSEIVNPGPKYYAVFRFTINDDAPISVEAYAQGKGYVNTKYTATAFDIQSSGNNVKYSLYYNSAENAAKNFDGWVKIPLLSEINEDYNENGFTYSDIEKIGYDGKYTFTPIKKGSYKIECYVTSDNSVRYATDSTVIGVSDNPSVVKVDNKWLQNNLWSVIFLSIGTLSLIGIIVLLFIKPKEEVERDETGEALKINAEK